MECTITADESNMFFNNVSKLFTPTVADTEKCMKYVRNIKSADYESMFLKPTTLNEIPITTSEFKNKSSCDYYGFNVVLLRKSLNQWLIHYAKWMIANFKFSLQNSTGDPVYRKVAVVENFFDIIYTVHVELEGRPGKHAGQKRTYRTITETYAFLPREAVTHFLLGCTECQKPRSPSPVSVLPTPSPSPTLPLIQSITQPVIITTPPIVVVHNTQGSELTYLDLSRSCRTSSNSLASQTQSQRVELSDCALVAHRIESGTDGPLDRNSPEPKQSSNPLDVCNLTHKEPSKNSLKTTLKKSEYTKENTVRSSKLWSPVHSIDKDDNISEQKLLMPAEIDYTMPITTTYLKYMRSLGCTDEDALKFESQYVSYHIECLLHDVISEYYN
ncbi:hypothetical protein HHI36_001600 [Cryptolaemus montrouzieri]|uniref:Integrase zinc-binding domain-containing protein n=1 Tax=Cryptolaemus montrouzieri TaxID=559131 RepID=A0ABD2P7Y3_9CUCU